VDNRPTHAGAGHGEPGFVVAGWDQREGHRIVRLRERRWRRATGERGILGQALVEFALVAPIMVLIFAALVQLAIIYERQIGIENAVRDAARRASTLPTITVSDADTNGAFVWNLLVGSGGLLQTNVQDYDGLAIVQPTVCYRTQLDAAGENAVFVKVSMGYKHALFLPIISQILDGFDNTQDNAIKVTTNSEFEVNNADTASVDRCYPP
jgi:Flp pilus assembly protein TadG